MLPFRMKLRPTYLPTSTHDQSDVCTMVIHDRGCEPSRIGRTESGCIGLEFSPPDKWNVSSPWDLVAAVVFPCSGRLVALIVSFESSLPFRSKDFEENMVQMTESLNYKRRRRYINLYTHSQRLRKSLRFISYLSRSWEKYTYLVLPRNFSIFIVSLSDFHS